MINLLLYFTGGGICALLGSLLATLSKEEPLLLGYDIAFYAIAGVFALIALIEIICKIVVAIVRRKVAGGHRRRRRR